MPVDSRREAANILLRVGAVSIDMEKQFRYASGILSPIYCDNRRVISYPAERRRIVELMLERVSTEDGLDFDVVAGTATAGIPWAAWVADQLEKPMVYVRGAAKDHGRAQRIEGDLRPGQRVLVVEDLVTTGGSSISTIDAIAEAGSKAVGCLAIFWYELPRAWEAFQSAGVRLLTVTDLGVLLGIAVERSLVDPARMDEVVRAIRQALEGNA